MRNCFTSLQDSLLTVLLLMFGLNISVAQTANNQNTVTQCYSGPTQSFTNTTGSPVGALTFTTGTGANQAPPGHRIVDVIVEVVWSKSDLGSCTPPTGTGADLSHVGFALRKFW